MADYYDGFTGDFKKTGAVSRGDPRRYCCDSYQVCFRCCQHFDYLWPKAADPCAKNSSDLQRLLIAIGPSYLVVH